MLRATAVALQAATAAEAAYVATVDRLAAKCRRTIDLDPKDVELALLCGEAAQTMATLRDAVAEARRLTVAVERPLDARAQVQMPLSWRALAVLPEVRKQQLELARAREARAELAAVRAAWPEIALSPVADETVDLFAGRRRRALLFAIPMVAGIGALASLSPYAAFGLGSIIAVLYLYVQLFFWLRRKWRQRAA